MYIFYPFFKRVKSDEVYEFRAFGYSSTGFVVHEQSYWIMGSDVQTFILSKLPLSLPKSVSEVTVYLYTTKVLNHISVPYAELISHFNL